MPDNPISGKAGNTLRLNQMLSFFNDDPNLEVHFVSLRDWGMWKSEEEILFKDRFPNVTLHLLDKKYKNNFFKYFFLYKIPYVFKNNSVDITSFVLRKEFGDVLKQISFDTIIISYASWGKLLNKNTNAYKIIDTHDFITAQNKNKTKKIGKIFQNEIDILKIYNEIWTYSVEEEYIFDQFTGKNVVLMPVSFPVNLQKHSGNYKYDVVYVASENPHNITGINWFLKEVLPFLKDVNVHIIGKIGNAILQEYPNVTKHGMVQDLEEFYTNARVAICPMLSGTGIKIKVLEALSYGLPVVTNRRGIDGLINKKNNGCIVCQDPKDFADNINQLIKDDVFYQNIKSQGISYFSENHNSETEKTIINLSLQKKVWKKGY